MIGELLRIKTFRETKAELEVSRARLELAAAIDAAAKARTALADYRTWSVNHERSLYADLCTKVVKAREIEWLREDVLLLRGKERELDAAIANADGATQKAEGAVKTARQGHVDATRNREKFSEVARIMAVENALEAARREETDLEDLYAIRRDRQDWGDEVETPSESSETA
jgi:type III secretion protein O